jgi:hypothetical protein
LIGNDFTNVHYFFLKYLPVFHDLLALKILLFRERIPVFE